jgi:hypothetical protein
MDQVLSRWATSPPTPAKKKEGRSEGMKYEKGGWRGRETSGQTDGWIDESMDGWIDGFTARKRDRNMDRKTERHVKQVET